MARFCFKFWFVYELIALFVSLPLWGAMLQATVEFCEQNVEGTTIVVDEVLEIYTVQTASTSSVLPCGNPPSPRGTAFLES